MIFTPGVQADRARLDFHTRPVMGLAFRPTGPGMSFTPDVRWMDDI
jgi:hypothetical protein